MNRALLVALLLAPLALSSQGVLAATSITVSVGGVQEVWNLSDVDQQKFEAWVQVAYKCMPVPPATTCTTVLADAESAWAKATLKGTADNVTRFQDTLAAKIAVEATTPIGFNVGDGTKKK